MYFTGNQPTMPDEQPVTADERLRGNIATKVLLFGTVTLCIVASIMVIGGIVLFVRSTDKNDTTERAIHMVQMVFNALLPVIATWVGTVIAFYFGKANFEAASKSAQDMVKQFANSDDKLRATKVSDPNVMRLFAEIIFNKEIVSKKDEEIMVQKDLIDFMDDPKNVGDRLPIFDPKNCIRYLIHESTLNEFARKLSSDKYPALKGKTIDTITLAQMVSNADDDMNNKLTKCLIFVAKTATLLEAKEKMQANKWSQDVFVTDNGIASEPVIGWITNNKIVEMSKI
jgi:hypothetical protein